MQLIRSSLTLTLCSVSFIALANASVIPSRSFVPAEGGAQLDRRGVGVYDTTVLRNAVDANALYRGTDKVDWWEIDTESNTNKMVVAQTTNKDEAAPTPEDEDQGSRYTVDHVLELQVIVAAFDQFRRGADDDAKAIDQAVWTKAHNLVNGFNDMADQTKRVAEEATVRINLRGVAERINLMKQVVFDKMTGKANPDTPLEAKWNDYLVPVLQYLKDKKEDVHIVIDNVADQIQEEVDPDDKNKVASYFKSYGKQQYDRGINYLAQQQATLVSGAVTAAIDAATP